MSLIGGIILLVVGIVLFAVSRALPPPASTIAYWLGIVLAVIGLILIIVAVVGIALFIVPAAIPGILLV
jgi:hypothetical protein